MTRLRRAFRLLAGLIVTAGALAALTQSAAAQKRVALVVGINQYPQLRTSQDPTRMQLQKAVADAETMGDVLRNLGFEVELARDAGRTAFLTALDRVKRRIAPGDTFFFFYAGHGVALKGTNLFLPGDTPPIDPDAEALLRGVAIAETDVIETAREKGAGLIILALDACRNNPIEELAKEQARVQGRAFRSLGGMRSAGLEARPTSGVFTIYSAGIGQTALDRLDNNDGDRNSVFTRVFARKLRESGRPLTEIMEDVKEEVATLASKVVDPETRMPHSQFPAYYNETRGGRIFLAGRTQAEPPRAPAAVAPAPSAPAQPAADEVAWSFIETTDDPRQIESFLARFPDSRRRPLAEARLGELRRRTQAAAPPPNQGAAGTQAAVNQSVANSQAAINQAVTNTQAAINPGTARPPAPPVARDPDPAVTAPPQASGPVNLAMLTGPALAPATRSGPVLTLVKRTKLGGAGEAFSDVAEAMNVEIARDPAKHGVPQSVLANRPTKIRKLAAGWLTLTRDQVATFYDPQGRPATTIALDKFFDRSPVRDGSLIFQRDVDDLTAAGNTLYFNVTCANTYAKTFAGKCAYLVAVDLTTQRMLWRSEDVSSRGPFLLAPGVVITGYGFTAEKDYVFALDAATGKTLQKILVDSTPEGMELNGKQLKAVSYGSILYEFRLN